MRKRKWYERMSAAVLIAVLLVNHGRYGNYGEGGDNNCAGRKSGRRE